MENEIPVNAFGLVMLVIMASATLSNRMIVSTINNIASHDIPILQEQPKINSKTQMSTQTAIDMRNGKASSLSRLHHQGASDNK